MIKRFLLMIHRYIFSTLLDDSSRKAYLFRLMSLILAITSVVMSFFNFFTHDYLLMLSPLLFAAASLLNIWLSRKHYPGYMNLVFGTEFLFLITNLIINGQPDGFSALWAGLVPAFSLFVFGVKVGSVYSLVTYLIMILLFWTPMGQSLLLYTYSETFLLRFPFLYITIYVLSLFVEYTRLLTHRSMTEMKNKYEHLYCHDALTGLYNRYGFTNLIKAAYDQHIVRNSAILLLDIDDFKKVNDRYGHDCGDAVLCHISTLIQNALVPNAQACRWGGEEIILFMHGSDDPLAFGEAIRKTIANSCITYNNQQIHVTVSVGICVAQNHPDYIISQMIREADNCLYEAKHSGKNCIRHTSL